MHFDDWYASLLARSKAKGVGPAGLRVLLKKLGNPQEKFNIIHVAGTNGKGSVCTLLAHALTCAGHRTGLFVSPHLISPTERIQIDGCAIAKNAFASVVQKVLARETKKLNFFEILTVAAFVYFAEKKVHYVVLETGLGGRKDPTNVCAPVVSVITSIGLDHTQILGHTLTQIAKEKAGIIKPNTPVFCAPLPLAAQRVIQRGAAAAHAPFYLVKEGEPFALHRIDWKNNRLILKCKNERWPLHLMGEKQVQNACLVYQICAYLKMRRAALKRAFKTVSLPGRWERFAAKNKMWILDGAHNPQAVRGLLSLWKKHPAYPHAVLLCGFMKDKNYKEMLRLLCPHFERVIVTRPPSPRAAQKKDYGLLLKNKAVHFAPSYDEARPLLSNAKLVFCTGSFYLVGALRKGLVGSSIKCIDSKVGFVVK